MTKSIVMSFSRPELGAKLIRGLRDYGKCRRTDLLIDRLVAITDWGSDQCMCQSALRSAAGGRNDASKISLAFGIADLKA